MKRTSRLLLSLFSCALVAGLAAGSGTLDSDRDAALERARTEQSLILSERTAAMLGHLFDVAEAAPIEEGR